MQVTIADSGSLSSAALFNAQRPAALYIPAGVEGSVVTFQGTFNGVDYYNLYSIDPTDGSTVELQYSFTAGSILLLPTEIFKGIQGIKVRTGTSGAPSNQTGAANIEVIGA